MRQFLCFSLAMLLSLASANAYTLEQPQLPEQIEAAILLNEDGTPRCRIGSAAELDASLDSLRECDERDELYARTIFGDEDINFAMAVGPEKIGEMVGVMIGTGIIATVFTCALFPLSNYLLFDEPVPNHPIVPVLVAVILAKPLPLTSIAFIGGILNAMPTLAVGSIGATLGMKLCGDIGRKSTSDDNE